jgi:alkanesulfonate monooxygenase SsuD/methylene tetrahydromethanopterin reductase-like flavin-dependent oxidoreductase (luciferase family)
MEFGVFLPVANPPVWPKDWHQLYQESLEQAELAERLGFGCVATSEHHFSSDGYLTNPLTLSAAIAARTKTIGIASWVLLLPLYHPLRVAEEAAIVDIVSGGRLTLGMALGYRWEEFNGFGVSRDDSGKIMDEAVEVLVRAFTEDKFSFKGRFFNLRDVAMTPKSYRKPRPVIWVGAPTSRAAVRRVARWGLEGFAGRPRTELYQSYLDECRSFGTKPTAESQVIVWGYCAEDPEQAWAEASPYAQWVWSQYREWWWNFGDTNAFGNALRKDFVFGDPDSWIRVIKGQLSLTDPPVDRVLLGLQLPGMSNEQIMRSMDLLATKVLPHFQLDLNTGSR